MRVFDFLIQKLRPGAPMKTTYLLTCIIGIACFEIK